MTTQLIEGITVLSQNLDYLGIISGVAFTVILGFLFIKGISIFYLTIKDKSYADSVLFGITSIILGLMLGFGAIPSIFEKPTTQYTVTIDEKVSLKDFNEKYQIIDQDGEIYTIVEKEEE